MDTHMPFCILVAELLGGPRPGNKAAATETGHALERCQNRMKLAVEGHGGQPLGECAPDMRAAFESVDAAVLSACEMIERIHKLPSVRGARFSVRIGIDLGTQGQDETSTEAARLSRLAFAGEGLLSTAAAGSMTASVRQFSRAEELVREGLEAGLVSIARQPAPGTLSQFAKGAPRLRVYHQGRTLYVDDKHPSLLIGREPGNDLMLNDPRASRHHARIEFRAGNFTLVDHSSNGSWVTASNGRDVFLKGTETALSGIGHIGLGVPGDEDDTNLLNFEIR